MEKVYWLAGNQSVEVITIPQEINRVKREDVVRACVCVGGDDRVTERTGGGN